MDVSARFSVAHVFPPNAEPASLARFLVVARQTRTLRHAFHAIRREPKTTLEASIVLLGCYVGSLKELSDAFRDIDGQGRLGWVFRLRDSLPDLAADIENARQATNRADPDSLYSRLLKRVRDTAGFHIPRGAVQQALVTMQDDVFHAADVHGEAQEVIGVPIVSAVLANLIWGRAIQPGDVTSTLDEAEKLDVALSNVAHDLYLLGVKIATQQMGPAA